MISAINVHNLHSTAREIVGRYSAPNRITAAAVEPEFPVRAVISPEIAAAFGIQVVPGLIEISPAEIQPREPEPAPTAAAAVIPAESSAAVLISRTELRKTLQTAERFNAKCPSKHVIVEIGSRTVITAVSVDGIVSQSIDGISGTTAAAAFPVAIDAKKAAALLGKIKTDCVTIQAKTIDIDTVLTIQADSAEFSLPADPVSLTYDDSPSGPAARLDSWKTREFSPDFGLCVSAAEILDSLRRIEYAMDTDSTRYALGGINLAFCRGDNPDSFQVDFAATDSRRLGLQQRPAGIGFMGGNEFRESSAVLCSAAVYQLMEILPRLNPDSAVWICFYDSKKANGEAIHNITDIVIESADGEFSIRVPMVEGRFPRYRDVIPKSTNFQSVFNRRQLLNSIETAAAVCNDENRGMDFAWDFRTEQRPFRLTAQSAEFGKSSVPVRCETCGNQPRPLNAEDSAEDSETVPGIVACTFDPKYIVEWLKTSDSENVSIGIDNTERAALFTDDSAGVYVVMPLSGK